jgi:hypothetical protein
MGYGYINFHILRWAPLGRVEAIDFGGRVVEWPSLKQCASRAAQRSNNEQQIAANNKTSPRI